jgi:hypothetical protein
MFTDAGYRIEKGKPAILAQNEWFIIVQCDRIGAESAWRQKKRQAKTVHRGPDAVMATQLSPDMTAHFARCEEKIGFVPNVLQAYSIFPQFGEVGSSRELLQ